MSCSELFIDDTMRTRTTTEDPLSTYPPSLACSVANLLFPDYTPLTKLTTPKLHNSDIYLFTAAYRPDKCKKAYRVVVVWKDLEVYEGQKKLFDDYRCFFYITNIEDKPAEEIVFSANDRCNQENLHAQLKGGVRSLTAPVDSLLANWAYMVMGSLAWSLKAWAALILPENGRWQEKHREEKYKLLRMEFATFRHAIMNIPAQIVRTGRKIIYRLLAWNPWQHVFFRLLDQLNRPLNC